MAAIHIDAKLMQKKPNLPRYVEIPASELAQWQLQGTTPIDVVLNGKEIGRRNLKHWGHGRDYWFFEVNDRICRQLAVAVGSPVAVVMRLASTDLPQELEELLKSSPEAGAEWNAMTESQRRMLADQVRSAKQVDTRVRRARKALVGT
jgi:hypothetical protein